MGPKSNQGWRKQPTVVQSNQIQSNPMMFVLNFIIASEFCLLIIVQINTIQSFALKFAARSVCLRFYNKRYLADAAACC